MVKIGDWQKIATHDGIFHADEVLAFAILKILKPDVNLIRTRNPRELAFADLRIDVGGEFRPSQGNFDHHQPGGAGERSNGVPYATAGLIWRDFGKRVVKEVCPELKPRQVNRVVRMVDEALIQTVDAYDIGIKLEPRSDDLAPNPYTLNDLVRSFNLTWDDQFQNSSQAFMMAWRICERVLKNEINLAASILIAEVFVDRSYQAHGRGKILILDRFIHWNIWRATVLALKLTDVLFAVVANNGGWAVYTQTAEVGSNRARKSLPISWADLKGEMLARMTGVSDAKFCRSRWVIGAQSYKGALQLARLAIES